jgi:sugar phosphate permease
MKQVNEAERQLIESGREPVTSEASNLGDPTRHFEPMPWSQMLRSVNVWGLCLMYGVAGFAGNFTTSLLPVYLDKSRHLSKGATTTLTSLPLALGIVSCALGGFLSDWICRHWGNRKWGRRFNGAVGLLLAGLAVLCVPWAESTWLLALFLCISFFGNDLNMGPAWAACADVGGPYAGTISGAMNMTGQLFGAAGTAFAGIMLQKGQADVMFFVFSCSFIFAALCWLAVDVTRPVLKGQ